MKKLFIIAAVAVAAASCAKTASIEEVNSSNVSIIDDSIQMPIQFGTSRAEVKSLTKAAVDAWNAEDLYIYGIPRASKESAELLLDQILIDNVLAAAPTAADGAIVVQDPNGNPFYYTDGKYYNFYAYYVADAAGADPAPDDELKLDVAIDGTQDIMLATTDNAADFALKTVDDANFTVAHLYSGYAARRGVQPNLVFNHKLARFIFNVKSGSPSAEDITINSISITSKVNATLDILEGTLTAADEDPVDLALCDAAGEADLNFDMPTYYTAAQLEADATINPYAQVGESIMVIPGEASHTITIVMEQENVNVAPEPIVKTINIPSGATEEGKKYNVNVTIYGLEEVSISVSLTAWEDGDEIDVDTEE